MVRISVSCKIRSPRCFDNAFSYCFNGTMINRRVIQLARYLKIKQNQDYTLAHMILLVCSISKISGEPMLMQGCVSNRDNGWKLPSCSRVTV